jgi:cysteine synthase A
VGLAWVGVAKGYKVILTMPDTMSVERRNLLKAYGAQLELTPGAEGMKGAIRRAEELRDATTGAVILGQFVNPANPAMHERTTGEEIWKDTEGQVDMLVAGAGTGGTVSGTGRALKKHKQSVKVVAVEPATSAVLSTGVPGKHKIQGLGAGFVPQTYDTAVVDEIMTVEDEAAFEGMRTLAKTQGLLVGISSGAAFSAALSQARDKRNKGKMIVAILPDTGERYLSMNLFD